MHPRVQKWLALKMSCYTYEYSNCTTWWSQCSECFPVASPPALWCHQDEYLGLTYTGLKEEQTTALKQKRSQKGNHAAAHPPQMNIHQPEVMAEPDHCASCLLPRVALLQVRICDATGDWCLSVTLKVMSLDLTWQTYFPAMVTCWHLYQRNLNQDQFWKTLLLYLNKYKQRHNLYAIEFTLLIIKLHNITVMHNTIMTKSQYKNIAAIVQLLASWSSTELSPTPC